VSAHDALAALARDLVEEISAGLAIELAAGQPAAPPPAARQPRNPILRGAAAVHPMLGQHLARLPGDTISWHAYKHLGMTGPQAGA
jgi:hypothetical protein